MRGLEQKVVDRLMLRFAAAGPGGPPNPNAPQNPPGPNAPPAPTPPNPATPPADVYTLIRNKSKLTVRDAVRKATINTADENVIRQEVEDFLRRNHLIPQAPPAIPLGTRLRLPRFRQPAPTTVVVPPTTPVQAPQTPNAVNQPPPPVIIHVDGSRPRQLIRNRYVVTAVLGAFLLGGIAGYAARDHNLFNFGANTRFTSQTIAPGECVDVPGGSIAVGKSSINGVILYSKDPSIEMVTRLNDNAQVCATGGESVTLQYLGGNSQLMDTVEQNDISLLQENGCNGRRCNQVTQITYPYP